MKEEREKNKKDNTRISCIINSCKKVLYSTPPENLLAADWKTKLLILNLNLKSLSRYFVVGFRHCVFFLQIGECVCV